MEKDDPYHLQRFLDAQEGTFETALGELARGRKESHWMWFIFPQIEGLGRSSTARRYAIKSRAEAEAYLRHPVLGARLQQSAKALLRVEGKTATQVMGSPDDLKLRSSMTLFALVAGEEIVFQQVLDKYYGGEKDLTHYAVETVLDYREGFFGLIAAGWEISDFAPPFPRGSIPTGAREVEIVVSLIDTERPDAAGWTAGEFREQGELYVASRRATGKDPGDMPALSDEDLDQIRVLRGELLERWAATKAGETLELVFGGPAQS